jgi:hypothetical protein
MSISTHHDIINFMLDSVSTEYHRFSPSVNGWYFILMEHGTWVDELGSLGSKMSAQNTNGGSSYGEFNVEEVKKFLNPFLPNFNKYFGTMATDIDIPQLNIEYESYSTRNRTINYASRINYTSDFNISYLDAYGSIVSRYHSLWLKYIEALRKGLIDAPPGSGDAMDSYFIDVPYYNAVYVVKFDGLSPNVRFVAKIMGVSPVGLPFKQMIGDRSKGALEVLNFQYKSNDIFYKFYTGNDTVSNPANQRGNFSGVNSTNESFRTDALTPGTIASQLNKQLNSIIQASTNNEVDKPYHEVRNVEDALNSMISGGGVSGGSVTDANNAIRNTNNAIRGR